ncbi:hypothetical protein [Bradyrhizobium sp. HKCCYLRH1032]|uniref:hypothetical protein n=2 Tax=Bradyrhizobium TaxID=374 RepID=UPI003EBC294B
MMDCPITFRCPQTGSEVDAILHQPKDDCRFETVTFETVSCPACSRFHFIHAMTGALIPPTLLGPGNWTP